MTTTIVSLEVLEQARAYIRWINKQPLESIEWHRNGKALKVDPKDLEEWKFIGLCNVDFFQFSDEKDGALALKTAVPPNHWIGKEAKTMIHDDVGSAVVKP